MYRYFQSGTYWERASFHLRKDMIPTLGLLLLLVTSMALVARATI